VGPIFNFYVLFFVEFVGHLARYLDCEGRRIEARDPSYSTLAIDRGLPEILPTDTVGADRTDTRYRYAQHVYSFALTPYASIG
jgi:hypothetical protein